MTADGWMTLQEICKAIGRSEQTIWRWEREGVIKVKYIGKVKMYK